MVSFETLLFFVVVTFDGSVRLCVGVGFFVEDTGRVVVFASVFVCVVLFSDALSVLVSLAELEAVVGSSFAEVICLIPTIIPIMTSTETTIIVMLFAFFIKYILPHINIRIFYNTNRIYAIKKLLKFSNKICYFLRIKKCKTGTPKNRFGVPKFSPNYLDGQ